MYPIILIFNNNVFLRINQRSAIQETQGHVSLWNTFSYTRKSDERIQMVKVRNMRVVRIDEGTKSIGYNVRLIRLAKMLWEMNPAMKPPNLNRMIIKSQGRNGIDHFSFFFKDVGLI